MSGNMATQDGDQSQYAEGTDVLSVGFAPDAKKINVKYMFVESKDAAKIRIVKYGSGDRRLLIVHGAAEYSGRYGYIINFFAENGYDVTFVELRGQGKSQGDRMSLRSKSWDELVWDMQAAAKTVDGDCTCLCHSNGGLTMAYATSTDQLPANIKKIVYSNPSIRPGANIMSRLVSSLPFSFRAPVPIKTSVLSDSKEANSHYQNDKLIPKDMHSSYVKAMVAAQDEVQKQFGTKGGDIPALFLIGTADAVVNHHKGLAWAEGQKAQLGDKCEIKIYPGRKHEMLNGTARDDILKDIMGWLHPASSP